MISGEDIILVRRVDTGEKDGFGKPIYSEEREAVSNVLISPTQAQDVLDVTDIEGRKASYTLAIPKGDIHMWEGQTVEFWGEKWKVYGIPLKGIEKLVPTAWNMKVTVERYE